MLGRNPKVKVGGGGANPKNYVSERFILFIPTVWTYCCVEGLRHVRVLRIPGIPRFVTFSGSFLRFVQI